MGLATLCGALSTLSVRSSDSRARPPTTTPTEVEEHGDRFPPDLVAFEVDAAVAVMAAVEIAVAAAAAAADLLARSRAPPIPLARRWFHMIHGKRHG